MLTSEIPVIAVDYETPP